MTLTTQEFIAPPCHQQIEVLFQDDDILVINKPSGLLSTPGRNPLNSDSVFLRMKVDYPTATMLHRLDIGTSGLLLMAKNKVVNGILTKQFQDRTVDKTYEAVLNGQLPQENGIIDEPISNDKTNFPRVTICSTKGKPSVSHYKVLERMDNPTRTRVLFTPQTGRTHQLRIHSQSIGHPILGCDLYGSDETEAMSDRLLLHAMTLDFDHPISGERMKHYCPCPF